MKLRLQRLSICECGFGVLHDNIPLGTEYESSGLAATVTFTCGSCGVKRQVEAIHVWRPGTKPGFIPYALFKPSN